MELEILTKALMILIVIMVVMQLLGFDPMSIIEEIKLRNPPRATPPRTEREDMILRTAHGQAPRRRIPPPPPIPPRPPTPPPSVNTSTYNPNPNLPHGTPPGYRPTSVLTVQSMQLGSRDIETEINNIRGE